MLPAVKRMTSIPKQANVLLWVAKELENYLHSESPAEWSYDRKEPGKNFGQS